MTEDTRDSSDLEPGNFEMETRIISEALRERDLATLAHIAAGISTRSAAVDGDPGAVRATALLLAMLWHETRASIEGWSTSEPIVIRSRIREVVTPASLREALRDAVREAAVEKIRSRADSNSVEAGKWIEWAALECPNCGADISSTEGVTRQRPPDPGTGYPGPWCSTCGAALQTAEAMVLRVFAQGRKQGVEPRPLSTYIESPDPQWAVVASLVVTAGHTAEARVIAQSRDSDGALVCSVLQPRGEYLDNILVTGPNAVAPYWVKVVSWPVEGAARALVTRANA